MPGELYQNPPGGRPWPRLPPEVCRRLHLSSCSLALAFDRSPAELREKQVGADVDWRCAALETAIRPSCDWCSRIRRRVEMRRKRPTAEPTKPEALAASKWPKANLNELTAAKITRNNRPSQTVLITLSPHSPDPSRVGVSQKIAAMAQVRRTIS